MTDATKYPWLSSVLKWNDRFAFRQIDDEMILVPIRVNAIEDNRLYRLNPTGARIWTLIDGQRTGSEIVRTLAEEYDAQNQTIQEDVDHIVSVLLRLEGITLERNP